MGTIIYYLSIAATISLPLVLFWIYTKIKGSIEHNYNKQTEELKGEISKNNTLLNSTVQSYFASSEKMIDKKIKAYCLLWKTAQKVKDHILPEMETIYNILTNDEIGDINAFEKIGKASHINEYRRLMTEVELKSTYDFTKKVALHRPFISDKAFKLFIVMQIFILRLRYMFIESYINREIYDWKKDKATVGILRASLTENEINYVLELDVYSLRSLIDIIEHKIIQTTKRDLNINHTAEDAVQYVRKMEDLFKSVNKDSKNS